MMPYIYKYKGWKRYRLMSLEEYTYTEYLSSSNPLKIWRMLLCLMKLKLDVRVHVYYTSNPLIDSGLFAKVVV